MAEDPQDGLRGKRDCVVYKTTDWGERGSGWRMEGIAQPQAKMPIVGREGRGEPLPRYKYHSIPMVFFFDFAKFCFVWVSAILRQKKGKGGMFLVNQKINISRICWHLGLAFVALFFDSTKPRFSQVLAKWCYFLCGIRSKIYSCQQKHQNIGIHSVFGGIFQL